MTKSVPILQGQSDAAVVLRHSNAVFHNQSFGDALIFLDASDFHPLSHWTPSQTKGGLSQNVRGVLNWLGPENLTGSGAYVSGIEGVDATADVVFRIPGGWVCSNKKYKRDTWAISMPSSFLRAFLVCLTILPVFEVSIDPTPDWLGLKNVTTYSNIFPFANHPLQAAIIFKIEDPPLKSNEKDKKRYFWRLGCHHIHPPAYRKAPQRTKRKCDPG